MPVQRPVDHVGDVALLQFVRCLHQQRSDRARGQALVHFEAVVGGKDIFADCGADDLRQSLAAIFLRRSEGRPACFAELLVSVLEPRRGGDRAVVGALAAGFVADAVQWLKHFLAEAAGLLENGGDEVGRGVGEAWEVRIAADVEDAIQYEKRFLHRRGIDGHGLTSVSVPILQPIGRPAPCIRRSARPVDGIRKESDR